MAKKMRGGQNEVEIADGVVHRPHHPWSFATRKLLKTCEINDLQFVPKWLGESESGGELFEYIDGEVGQYPLPDFLREDVAIESAAKLMRRLHDATIELAKDNSLSWQFDPIRPAEVVCHGDFAPYNCVFKNGVVVGIFDFDAARPAPRAWDISYALYRFVPLLDFGNLNDGFGDLANRLRRMSQFVEAYGGTNADAIAALRMIPQRLESLVQWMYSEAAAGNEHCVRSLKEQHHKLYLSDIQKIGSFCG